MITKLKGINYPVLIGAALVIPGFFLTWIGVGESKALHLSGFQLALNFGSAYYAAALLPALAIVVAVLAFTKPRIAAWVSAATGATAIVWGLIEMARFLADAFHMGLGITVLGCLVMFAGGIFTRRFGKPKAAKEDAVDEAESARTSPLNRAPKREKSIGEQR